MRLKILKKNIKITSSTNKNAFVIKYIVVTFYYYQQSIRNVKRIYLGVQESNMLLRLAQLQGFHFDHV